MNLTEQIAHFALLQTVRLQAVATYMLRALVQKLSQLQKDIEAELTRSGLESGLSGSERRQRLSDFSNAIETRITEVYREIRKRLESDFESIRETSEQQTRELYGNLKRGKLAYSGLVLGLTLRQWMQKQAGDLQLRAEQEIQQGLNAGEDLDKLFERVKGTNRGIEEIQRPPITTASKRALEVIVRTGVQTVADEVSTEAAQKLPKSVQYGWQQISVLDGRTTQICRAYAYKIWNKDFKPIGHKLPYNGGVPRHPNCRSSTVLYMLDDGPVKELTFREWMATLSRKDKDLIFGASRVDKWERGILKDGDLIRQQEHAIKIDDL